MNKKILCLAVGWADSDSYLHLTNTLLADHVIYYMIARYGPQCTPLTQWPNHHRLSRLRWPLLQSQ